MTPSNRSEERASARAKDPGYARGAKGAEIAENPATKGPENAVDAPTANHRAFLEHLEQSKGGVQRVAQWLVERGNTVVMPPSTAAATASQWKDHADGGDLFIQQRVEVKHRGISFTGADDFPYPTLFVCSKDSWDRAMPKPYAFINLSADMRFAAVAMGSTRPFWVVVESKDPRYGPNYRQSTYECPVANLVFIEL